MIKTTMNGRMTWGGLGLSMMVASLLCLTIVLPVRADNNKVLQVIAGESVPMTIENVAAIAIADPTVGDVVKMGDTSVFSIIGKKPGVTTLTVVYTDGKPTDLYRVEVSQSAGVRSIHQAIGSPQISVEEVGDAVVLQGKVKTQMDSDRAQQVAAAYKGKVINLIEVTNPKRVKIRTRLVEVNTSAIKNLGIEYFGQNGAVTYGFLLGGIDNALGPITHGFQLGANPDPNQQQGYVQATLHLLASKNLAKTLSEPTMVTLSGKEASFLSGGEVPIVQTLANSSTVQYKEYGVRLAIKPVVDSEDNISSHLMTEVSQANFAQTVAGEPTFVTRRAETEVQVKDGQTIVIGGLLQNTSANVIRKVPWLGNIPVLGILFRSKSYQQGLSELLVFVTLEVMEDVQADAIRAPQTPELKIWNGKEADQELRQRPEPDPNWQKPLNVDELTIPEKQPAVQKVQPVAAPSTGATEPKANFGK